MVSADLFLKTIPLLAEKGNHTLGQARGAAQRLEARIWMQRQP